jgi:hypothetical protein
MTEIAHSPGCEKSEVVVSSGFVPSEDCEKGQASLLDLSMATFFLCLFRSFSLYVCLCDTNHTELEPLPVTCHFCKDLISK